MPQAALQRSFWPLAPMLLTALVLTSCAALRLADAPSCAGPRRAANTHGSVLASEPVPSPTPATNGVGQCVGLGR